MATPKPFPWAEAMKFGFGVMHLSPKEFWSLTIRELDAAMRANYGDQPAPLDRHWLEQVMLDNPDKTLKKVTS